MKILNNKWVQAGSILFLLSLFNAGAIGLITAFLILTPGVREKLGLDRLANYQSKNNAETPDNVAPQSTSTMAGVNPHENNSNDESYRFYVKAEPSGEISCSKASEADAAVIINAWLAGDVDVEAMQELAREWSVCGLMGIFGSGGETDFTDEPTRTFGETHVLPKNETGDYEPGIYVILSAITKASLEIDIPSLNSSNVKELELSYQGFDFPVEHPLYGKLKANVLTGIQFRNEFFDHAEISDRGYDLVTHIVFAAGRKCSVMATFKNDEELTSGIAGNETARTLIELAEYSSSELNDQSLAEALVTRVNQTVDEYKITNEPILSAVQTLKTKLEMVSDADDVVQDIALPYEVEKVENSDANPDHFVIAVTAMGSIYSRTMDADDYSGNIKILRDAALKVCTEMVTEITYRLDGFVDCLAAKDTNDSSVTLLPYSQAIESGAFDDDFESFFLLLRFNNVHDSDFINQEFLAMDEWDFYAHWFDEQDRVRTQGYASGEFDTGYFAAIEWGDDETEYLDSGPSYTLHLAASWIENSGKDSRGSNPSEQNTLSASSTYDLILVDTGDKVVNVIKAVRAITGLDLPSCKVMVDNVLNGEPTVIITGLSSEEAIAASGKIEKVGGKARLDKT